MTHNQQPALTAFVIGMFGLGILALIYGDFAMVWQPVPDWIPGRLALAYLSGIIMLLAGAGLLFRATSAWAARILFPYLLIWMCLKLPPLFLAPRIEGVWLGFGELAVLFIGGWFLCARVEGALPAFLLSERTLRVAKIFFGIWLVPIGLSHIVYLKETVSFVPAWLPYREGWAYLTGIGHIAAGLGILFSVLSRVAAFAEAAMIGVFTILVWGPRIAMAPRARLPWTAFFISWVIASAAWIVAQNIAVKPRVTEDLDTRKVTMA